MSYNTYQTQASINTLVASGETASSFSGITWAGISMALGLCIIVGLLYNRKSLNESILPDHTNTFNVILAMICLYLFIFPLIAIIEYNEYKSSNPTQANTLALKYGLYPYLPLYIIAAIAIVIIVMAAAK